MRKAKGSRKAAFLAESVKSSIECNKSTQTPNL